MLALCLVAFARATLRDKKKKERRGPRKRGGGGENSPISPPLDPRLPFFSTKDAWAEIYLNIKINVMKSIFAFNGHIVAFFELV